MACSGSLQAIHRLCPFHDTAGSGAETCRRSRRRDVRERTLLKTVPMLTVTLNPALDIAFEVQRVEPERKLHGRNQLVEPGGGGVNVARVATELGATCPAYILVGGPTGERLLSLLVREGIDTEAIWISGTTREDVTVSESSTGRHYRFVLPGPTVTHRELAELADLLQHRAGAEELAVVSGSLPEGTNAPEFAALLRSLRAAGAQLVVDTSGPALQAAAETGTLLMKPSRRELAEVSGHALETERDIELAARQLLAMGPNRHVVVSLGGAGAVLVSNDVSTRRYHAPLVDVVSTVGAGDSLVSAVSVALDRGADVVEAARWGVAAGTATTTLPGTGLCRRAEVERLVGEVVVHTPSSK